MSKARFDIQLHRIKGSSTASYCEANSKQDGEGGQKREEKGSSVASTPYTASPLTAQQCASACFVLALVVNICMQHQPRA